MVVTLERVMVTTGNNHYSAPEINPPTTRIGRAVKTAFFSILSPGKRIPPHAGPYHGVLRLHWGCCCRSRPSAAGSRSMARCGTGAGARRCLFDDAHAHEVHNDTEGYRVVLFVDFERPCRWPANWLNRWVLNAAMFTPLPQDALKNQSRWEQRFYGKQGQS